MPRSCNKLVITRARLVPHADIGTVVT